MRLQTKIILSTMTIFIIALLFMGILIFSNSKKNIETQITDRLASTSQVVENNIENFLTGQENKIELMATQSELTNEELLQMLKLDDSFYDLFVIDENGKVIISSNPARTGLDRSTRDYFIKARNQTYLSPVYFALVPQEYSIAVSTPFHSGVLVGAMKLDDLNKIVSDRTGFGKTEENLLAFINERGNIVYFSDRLFSDKKMEELSTENSTGLPIYQALNKTEGLFLNLKDYRGVPVISATHYIDSIKVGMVTKIDSSEAYSPVYHLQVITIFLILIIIILIAIVIYILTREVSKEIVSISKDIDSITKGNLDIQLKKSSLFEIQNLTDSLNRILASMKLAILRLGIDKGEIGIGEAILAKEEAENRYRIIYESSADAIMTLEPPEWRFTSGNPATLRMFNLKNEEELTKLTPGDLSPKYQPDGKLSSNKMKKVIEIAMKKGSNFFNWMHKRYKGKDFPATVLLNKLRLGGKDVLQATVRDLSKENNK